MAKLIIKLINARRRRRQPATRRSRDRLKVVFLPDFNVKNGQRIYPGRRPVRADLDGRQGGLGHRQHEVRDERRAHDRHARRRQRRDPRGGRRRELLPVRPDRRGGRRAKARGLPAARATTSRTPELREAHRPDRRRRSSRAATASCSGRSSTRCSSTTTTCCSPTIAPTSTARQRVERRLSRPASAGRACRSSTSRASGHFSSDRSIREYCRDIWNVTPRA